ncbi:hypothetical protein T492DRAFT_1132613 [Pavlovales sp. CCMP2436]|nr:hypothetical protein T492DRAFT_1132613 [Pavlovales sp. CCMP2436]
MHSYLKNLLPDVIKLRDDLQKQQAADAGVTGSDVYAMSAAYGYFVPKEPPKLLPFVATPCRDIADSDWVPKKQKRASVGVAGGAGAFLLFSGAGGAGAGSSTVAGGSDFAGAVAGTGATRGAGGVKPAHESYSPHFAVAGPAKFIPSMRQLCASDLDSRVIKLFRPDGGTMVIPLVKHMIAIIAHAQQEGVPAVLVHPRGVTAHINESKYVVVRYTGLCEFLISLP